jgi:hypothetical protein
MFKKNEFPEQASLSFFKTIAQQSNILKYILKRSWIFQLNMFKDFFATFMKAKYCAPFCTVFLNSRPLLLQSTKAI